MRQISFTVFGKPQPQGSSRAFVIGGKAHITSANPNLHSFRQEVSKVALLTRQRSGFTDLVFGKHVPAKMIAKFFYQRPESIPKKRVCHVVKPDIDKTLRSITDAMTGIVYHDDAQIVAVEVEKHYGAPERVELTITEYQPAPLLITQT